MKNVMYVCALMLLFAVCSCSKSSSPAPVNNNTNTTTTTLNAGFAKGADVSWVTQMEASGNKFYDKNGNQQDLFVLMKSIGFNAIRLRAWVNPSGNYNTTADVVAKAVRAKNAGLKVMIDLHYSDTWADPGNQAKPAAWASLTPFSALVGALSTYTTGVMNSLKSAGVTPDWVQVGNETNDGMLWQDGRASVNMANFAALVQAGYTAVKSVSSTTQVIVHVSNGYDNNLFHYVFDGLKANGATYDIIGMSLYPTASTYASYDTQCLANINDMVSRYGKPCMVVEVGFAESDPAGAKAFLSDIIAKVNSVANGNGLGVFYWEPEAYNSWQGYGLGAFDSTGKPTSALDAFAAN